MSHDKKTKCASACKWVAPLAFLLVCQPGQTFGQTYDGFTYSVSGANVTITGYSGVGGAVTIPDTIPGAGTVTSIGDWALAERTGLTSITIPNGVTSIGEGAYAFCTGMISITIPNSVTFIGDRALEGCKGLIAINVDSNNASYSSQNGVLFNKSRTVLNQYPAGIMGTYTIPNSVTSIGNGAFAVGTGLTGIIIPNSVTNIGAGAFESCTSLTGIIIPNSVTSIGNWVFGYCSGLTNISIPNSVTSIEDRAFAYCTSLTSITIPNSVTSIGGWAFEWCTSLTSVYFQGNAPSLGLYVFDSGEMYYLPGTTGWEATFGGRPTALWNPQPLATVAGCGVRTNQYGFSINGTEGISVVVEACTNLTNPVWYPVGTNLLTDGTSYFKDPDWGNLSGRFYRLRMP